MNVSYCHICTCKCLSLHGPVPPSLPLPLRDSLSLSLRPLSLAHDTNTYALRHARSEVRHESYDLHVDKLVDYLRCTKVSIGEPRALYARSYTFFPLFDGIREAINADSCLPSGLVSLFVIHLFNGTAPPLYTEFCGTISACRGRGGRKREERGGILAINRMKCLWRCLKINWDLLGKIAREREVSFLLSVSFLFRYFQI